MNSNPTFSLVKGGPFYGLLVRVRLLKAEGTFAYRAALLLALIAWGPLLLLSLLQGKLIGDAVEVPFLYAAGTHIRCLLAVPLYILAEPFIDSRLAMAAGHLENAGLLRANEVPRFELAVQKAAGMRDSTVVEALIFLVALAAMILGLHIDLPPAISTWQLSEAGAPMQLTTAGWWNAAVSTTIFRFLFLRWLWRLLIWTVFLVRVSRLNLRLSAVHPDYAGGLLFLGVEQSSWNLLVFAASCVVSATIGQSMVYEGLALASFRDIILLNTLIWLALIFGPLTVFSPGLFSAKFNGVHTYSLMSTAYSREFNERWIAGEAYKDDAFLGTEDIQSLAALDQILGIVRNMRAIPFSLRQMVLLVASAVAPMLPLVLLEIPVDEIALKLMEVLF